MKRIVKNECMIIGNNFTHEFVLFEVCAVAQVIFKIDKNIFLYDIIHNIGTY